MPEGQETYGVRFKAMVSGLEIDVFERHAKVALEELEKALEAVEMYRVSVRGVKVADKDR